jgi:hypothetical protein
MRPLHLAIGGAAAVAALGGIIAWRVLTPSKLGLDRPRLVIVSGDASVDGQHARAALPFNTGATVHTGHGSACFSVHASRVCIGANGEVKLTELAPDGGGGTLEVHKGTLVIAAASGEELHLVLNGLGTLTVRGATVALEDTASDPTVRALDNSATIEVNGRPAVVVAAPDSVGFRDGRKRAPIAPLEKEERSVVQLSRRWQGSAGAVVSYFGLHGRVEVDDTDIGGAPAAVLLDEGPHTLVVRDGNKEVVSEKLTLKAGQKIERGS